MKLGVCVGVNAPISSQVVDEFMADLQLDPESVFLAQGICVHVYMCILYVCVCVWVGECVHKCVWKHSVSVVLCAATISLSHLLPQVL